MKLRFLGQSYSASFNHIETKPSEQTGRFLGQEYTISHPIKTNKSQLGLRKYRGVTYGV